MGYNPLDNDLPAAWRMTRRVGGWAQMQGNEDVTHENIVFPHDDNEWEIPALEPVTTWPTRLFRYEGRFRKTPQPGDCLHFFIHDYRMEPIWRRPRQVVSVFQRVGMMLTPDFSVHYEAPRAVHIYNVYRNRWMGRFAAAHGVVVIPTLSWCDWTSLDYCLAGLPRGGLVAVSMQWSHATDDRKKIKYDGLHELVKRVAPAGLIIYGESMPLPDLGVEVRRYPTHMAEIRRELKSRAAYRLEAV